MSGPAVDLYVLVCERSQQFIEVFREKWLKGFQGGDTFPYPDEMDMVGAEIIYNSPFEVIERLLAEPNREYSFYWFNSDKSAFIPFAMLFFTPDGAMIAGLSTADEISGEGHFEVGSAEKPSQTTEIFLQLAETMKAQFGYSTIEQPPPNSISEFVQVVQREMPPKLVAGHLVLSEAVE